MTLLLVETRVADKEFGERWAAWQRQQGWAALATDANAALFDHCPLLLYEYFSSVPLGAARRVALAARAGATASRLRLAAAREGSDPARIDRACEWLQRFSAEELRHVFPSCAPIWQALAIGHDQLREAFQREQSPDSALAMESPEHFWDVVADKTGLAHVTAEVFASLAGQSDLLAPVKESQSHLYAGLMLHHQCVNWKQDFLRGYRSHVVARLIGELGGAGATEAEREASVPVAGRRFYYGGLAERVLDAAAEHLCRAMAAVTDLPPGSWVAMLAQRHEEIRRLRADLARIRRDRLAKALRTAARPDGSGGRNPAHARPSPEALDAAAHAAAGYLWKEQAPTGNWGDFLLLGQQSTSWVTGYVGWNLAVSGMDQGGLDAAARWLVGHQLAGGGWSYNHDWPVDVDSTANALLFLSALGGMERDRWAPAQERLLAAQRLDGGFATITDPEAWLVRFRSGAADLQGWTASHPCVTAVVTLLLARLGGARERTAASRALSYLQGCQRPEGHWEAYWWVGRLYTTCRAVQATTDLRRHVEPPRAASSLARAAASLIGGQRSDGGWAGNPEERSAAFHTALAVQALCRLRRAIPSGRANAGTGNDALARAAAGGVRWLLAHQLPDGSWPTTPILRVPRPEVAAPWDQIAWTDSIVGLDVVVADWRRLFTSATAMTALREFEDGANAWHAPASHG